VRPRGLYTHITGRSPVATCHGAVVIRCAGGLVGCGADRVATVALKSEDAIPGGAGFTKLQNDVCLGAAGPSLNGKSLEKRIGD
jgi:hypothetical protein